MHIYCTNSSTQYLRGLFQSLIIDLNLKGEITPIDLKYFSLLSLVLLIFCVFRILRNAKDFTPNFAKFAKFAKFTLGIVILFIVYKKCLKIMVFFTRLMLFNLT